MDMRPVPGRKRFKVRPKEILRAGGYSPAGASLRLRASGMDTLIDELRAGLPFKTLQSFSSESGIGVGEIVELIELPKRTLARRKVAARPTSGESERLLRLAKFLEQAVRLFEGNVPAAVAWLKPSKRALGDKSPWTYLQPRSLPAKSKTSWASWNREFSLEGHCLANRQAEIQKSSLDWRRGASLSTALELEGRSHRLCRAIPIPCSSRNAKVE
jgi:putative toxin-antitoxin system antitoxin component (TIGR02293 family)